MISPGNFLHSDNPRVPVSEFPFRHSVRVQVRFTDCDMLGHVNNTMYLSYMDLGKVEYFAQILPGGVDMRHINIAIVNVNVDFYAQTFFGEEVEVWTAVSKVGPRSITLEQRIINPSTGQTKCIGRTVMAPFDPETATSRPVREDWVRSAEAFECRRLRKED